MEFPIRKKLCLSICAMAAAFSALTCHGTWQPGPVLHTARDQFAGGVVDGKLIVFGGNGNPGGINLKSTEMLDPGSAAWVYKATNEHNGGWGAEELSGATVNGKFYVLGGWGGGAKYGVFNFVEEYDPATNTWSTKAAMPTTRASGTAVTYNNKIYYFGGYYENEEDEVRTNYRTVEAYNPADNTWVTETEMPTYLQSPYIAVVGSKAYVIGGYSGSFPTGNFVSNVSSYDFLTKTWTTTGYTPMPQLAGFGYASAAPTKDGKIYLVHGYEVVGTNLVLTGNVSIYDTNTNSWQRGKALPIGTGSGYFAIINNDLWVVGGWAGEMDQNEEDVVVGWTWKHNLTDLAASPGYPISNNNWFTEFGSDWIYAHGYGQFIYTGAYPFLYMHGEGNGWLYTYDDGVWMYSFTSGKFIWLDPVKMSQEGTWVVMP